MATIRINTELALAALRRSATTLKAAIAVSAAAILSETDGDLQANSSAALAHFDDFGQKLEAVSAAVQDKNALAAAVVSHAGVSEVDLDALGRQIELIHGLLKTTKRSLRAVVGSRTRDGIDIFAGHVGSLGRSLQHLAFHAGEPAATTPFMFEQFFLKTMADLGQRDWSDGA